MKVKMDVDRIRQGMFVAELDRPWLGTPFLFQGFLVESENEILQLRELCKFVFVDDLKSCADKEIQDLILSNIGGVSGARVKRISVEFEEWKGAEKLRQTLRRVNKVQIRSADVMSGMLRDVRMGKSIKSSDTRKVITGIVDTVTANPKNAIWLTMLKSKHEEIANHSLNVSVLAASFAKYLDYPLEKIDMISVGALLHDSGLAKIPAYIINKPGPLSKVEFELVKKHAAHAADVLKSTGDYTSEVIDIVRHHHERLDGTGYPDGLVGHEIPEYVQVVTIADVYESMTTDKPYEKAVTPATAMARLHKRVGTHFSKYLVEAFIRCLGIYPLGSLVQLNNNAMGIVVSSQEENRLKPVLLLVKDQQEKYMLPRKMVNLAAFKGYDELAENWSIARIVDPGDCGIDVRRILLEEFTLR